MPPRHRGGSQDYLDNSLWPSSISVVVVVLTDSTALTMYLFERTNERANARPFPSCAPSRNVQHLSATWERAERVERVALTA